MLVNASARCWGFNGDGQLGYGNTLTVGDDEPPASVGPVNFGPGRTVTAIAAGDYHTCAILDDGTVRCWGFGGDGRLGYANTRNIRDPSSVGPVDLGGKATAISAGAGHTCAILDDGTVRCWGYGGGGQPIGAGRLGYGNTDDVGDDETPGSVAPVKLGEQRTAVAISAGGAHTCAILDDQSVRCWGTPFAGQLGYGNINTIGASPTRTPDTTGPVKLGAPAVAISAGGAHTCAILDTGGVRCWGENLYGQLGYGNTTNLGDNNATPDTAGPVRLGSGRTAIAISAGDAHTCAVLDDGSVRCWGFGANGRLGYPTLDDLGNQPNIGATP
ncbi:MAG: chromosome condensation regulator, partial [Actinobacteria bacterium]|nr:chromosome condensation regulator [Actinomycetota bacterium]